MQYDPPSGRVDLSAHVIVGRELVITLGMDVVDMVDDGAPRERLSHGLVIAQRYGRVVAARDAGAEARPWIEAGVACVLCLVLVDMVNLLLK